MNPRFILCLALFCLLFTTGCDYPAQMHWSPDGSRAAYFGGDANMHSFLIDEHGKILADLGQSTGGLAWAHDGHALYFGGMEPQPQSPPTRVDRRWLPEAAIPAPNQQQEKDPTQVTVSRWRDGKSEELFRLDEDILWYLIASPEGRWIAAVASKDKEPANHLYVYSLQSGKLFALGRVDYWPATFTAANKLVTTRLPAGHVGEPISAMALLTEITLDEGRRQLAQDDLLVLQGGATCIQPLGRDLLFAGTSLHLPSKSEEQPKLDLFHYSRQAGTVKALAENVGPLFMPSPDGRRILYEQKTGEGDDSSLVVMNANGSDPHVLREDLRPYGRVGMWPAWRGNDHITLVTTEPGEHQEIQGQMRTPVEVLLYRMNEQMKLETVRTLSELWPVEMKPVVEQEDSHVRMVQPVEPPK